jgi:hypothetical protein
LSTIGRHDFRQHCIQAFQLSGDIFQWRNLVQYLKGNLFICDISHGRKARFG